MTMPNKIESDSRKLLIRLRDTMAEEAKGQDRLDKITLLIGSTIGTEVCSIYLLRDSETLELCATQGLEIDAVHQTRMRIGEGLVGKVAKRKLSRLRLSMATNWVNTNATEIVKRQLSPDLERNGVTIVLATVFWKAR